MSAIAPEPETGSGRSPSTSNPPRPVVLNLPARTSTPAPPHPHTPSYPAEDSGALEAALTLYLGPVVVAGKRGSLRVIAAR